MKMIDTSATKTTAATVTFREMLQVVFPPTGLLRLVADNGNDAFYRRVDGQWFLLGQERAGLDAFIVAHGTANVAFSPVAWRAAAISSPVVSEYSAEPGAGVGRGKIGR